VYLQRVITRLLGHFSESAIAIIVVSLTVRSFGMDKIGQVSLAMASIGIFSIIMNLGSNSFLIKSIAEGKNANKHFSNFLFIKLLLIVLFLIIIVVVWTHNDWHGTQAKLNIIAVCYFIILSLFETTSSIFTAKQKYIILSIQNVVSQTIKLAALVWLIIYWQNIVGLALLFIIEISSKTIISIYYLIKNKIKLSRPNKQILKNYIQYTIPFIPSSLSNNFFVHFDKIIIGYLLNPTAVGILVIAQSMFSPISGVIKTITSTAFPKIVSDVSSAPHELSTRFKKIIKFNTFVAGFLVIQTFILSEPIARLLYGKEEASTVALLVKIYCLVIFGSLLMRPYHSLIIALNKHHKYQYIISWLSPSTKLLLYLLLVPSQLFGLNFLGLGILAIPLIAGLMWFIVNLPLTLYTLRNRIADLHLKFAFSIILSSVATITIALFLNSFFGSSSLLLDTITGLLIANSLFLIINIARGTITNETFRILINAIINFKSFTKKEINDNIFH
jgi:polysaccharide transporter, PST family